MVHVPFKGHSQNPGPGSSHEVITFQFDSLIKRARLAHRVCTRHGGISEPPYDTLNTSFGEGDRAENIKANLRIVMAAVGATRLAFMNQLHGKRVSVLRRDNFRDLNGAIDGDAIITDVTDLALMVKQADCQAVILFDPVKRVIANIHCGWRGNTHDIIASVVNRMIAVFACKASDMWAAIGPSLGPCCAEFVTHKQIFPKSFDRFMIRKNYFDLWEISRWQRLEAGLKKENIEIAGICTRCRTDLFFSYRDEGTTGRFATVVMLT